MKKKKRTRRKLYACPSWAIAQNVRLSGLVEDICHHGVGHPNDQWLDEHPEQARLSIHGCDGCCSKPKPIEFDGIRKS